MTPALTLGWTVNRSLLLGVTRVGGRGDTDFRSARLPDENGEERAAGFSYTGALVGWAYAPAPAVRTSLTTVLGRGKVRFAEKDETVLAGKVYVIEPMAKVDVQVFRAVRLSVGAGYRFTTGGDYRGIEKGDLRGATARIGLTLGPI